MSGADEMTTIAITRSTRERLYEHMRGKMTADEVLNDVLDRVEAKGRRGSTSKMEAPASS
jgi:hypothetical protein